MINNIKQIDSDIFNGNIVIEDQTLIDSNKHTMNVNNAISVVNGFYGQTSYLENIENMLIQAKNMFSKPVELEDYEDSTIKDDMKEDDYQTYKILNDSVSSFLYSNQTNGYYSKVMSDIILYINYIKTRIKSSELFSYNSKDINFNEIINRNFIQSIINTCFYKDHFSLVYEVFNNACKMTDDTVIHDNNHFITIFNNIAELYSINSKLDLKDKLYDINIPFRDNIDEDVGINVSIYRKKILELIELLPNDEDVIEMISLNEENINDYDATDIKRLKNTRDNITILSILIHICGNVIWLSTNKSSNKNKTIRS